MSCGREDSHQRHDPGASGFLRVGTGGDQARETLVDRHGCACGGKKGCASMERGKWQLCVCPEGCPHTEPWQAASPRCCSRERTWPGVHRLLHPLLSPRPWPPVSDLSLLACSCLTPLLWLVLPPGVSLLPSPFALRRPCTHPGVPQCRSGEGAELAGEG